MTPWYDDAVTFEGVPLDELMDAVGARGDTVLAIALNDYTAEVLISDFEDHGAILAIKRDGEYMTVRAKGPLFIVYPYDSDEALHNQVGDLPETIWRLGFGHDSVDLKRRRARRAHDRTAAGVLGR